MDSAARFGGDPRFDFAKDSTAQSAATRWIARLAASVSDAAVTTRVV